MSRCRSCSGSIFAIAGNHTVEEGVMVGRGENPSRDPDSDERDCYELPSAQSAAPGTLRLLSNVDTDADSLDSYYANSRKFFGQREILMKFTRKAQGLTVLVLLFAAFAGAQVPCRPTATSPCPTEPTPTPYSTAQFSATFNGPVETWSEPNVQKTSMDIFYASKANRVEQTEAYRTINGELYVRTAFLDFYVKAHTKKRETWKSPHDGAHHVHIFAYFEVQTANEPPRLRIPWLLIQNSHTVFVVMQSTTEGIAASQE